jgi:arylsulfatase A
MPKFITCLLIAGTSITFAAAKPNILVVLTDDIGWGDPACYNPQSKIPTPHIDKLAGGGMRFTHAHTPAALCAPTRYSMLSGNYPWRGRNPSGTWGFNVPSHFKQGQQAIPQLLRPAGYRCAMFGKAGLGGFWGMKPGEKPKNTPAPIEWGFDYSYLIPRGHQSLPHAFFENGVVTTPLPASQEAPGWDPRDIGESLLKQAVGFLEDHRAKHAGEPFYLHFCTDGAHGPWKPADSLAGTKLKGATGMTDHTDMVHQTDILLGALLATLDRLGLAENTVVVYTSDNGGLPYERSHGHDAVAGLRGDKSTIFEGGTRVPFVVSWPGKIAAGSTYGQPVGTHDLVATALDLAGLEKPAGHAIDSISLKPVLLGAQPAGSPVREFLLTQSSPGRGPSTDNGFRAGKPGPADPKEGKTKKQGREMAFAMYQGDWKLVLTETGKPFALYDLSTDLGEENDVLEHHPQRAKSLAAEFRRLRK